MMQTNRIVAAVLLPLVLLACKTEPAAVRNGRTVFSSAVQELQVSPSGAHVVTLADPARPTEPNVPRDVVIGGLTLAPVAGGPARHIGGGVSNLPGAWRFSLDGRWIACLAAYSFSRGVGELRLVSTEGGEPLTVAERVTFYGFSPDGERLAYVSNGELFVVSTSGGEPKAVASGVSLMEFGPRDTPAAGKMLVKRSVRSGGALLVYDIERGELKAVARGVGNFGFSPTGDAFVFEGRQLLAPDAIAQESAWGSNKPAGREAPGLYLVRGDAEPRRLNETGAGEFRFSPDGRRLAFVPPPEMGRAAGDLYIVEGDGEPVRVAPRVTQFRFAPDGTLALLGAYSTSSSAGTLGILRDGTVPLEVARNVKVFSFSPRGGHLLFSHLHNLEGYTTVALSVHRIDAPEDAKPRFIDTGVFGYAVDVDDHRLAYKARCSDEAKACTLFLADLRSPESKPEPVVERAAAFEFLPSGDLALITSRRAGKHTGRLVFSMGLLPAGGDAVRPLHDDVSGQFVLAGRDRAQVAFLVAEGAHRGLFVAETSSVAKAVSTGR